MQKNKPIHWTMLLVSVFVLAGLGWWMLISIGAWAYGLFVN